MMKRVEKTHLPVAALTHPGMKGKNNEDRFGVSAFRLKTQPETPVLLAVLSDGIGGNRAGEVASELAVNLISQTVADSDGRNPPQILAGAIQLASERIYVQAQDNPEQQGMGATCACAWIVGDRLFTATVGDSRIDLMRGEAIHQLSTDHTWILGSPRARIDPAGSGLRVTPMRMSSAVTLAPRNPPEVDFRIRFNGSENSAEAQIELANQGLRLLPNDLLLLCSDGLTDLVNDGEILSAFREGTLDEAGQKLIDLANQRGGHDNITLVAIQIPETAAILEADAVPDVKRRSRTLLAGCLVVILLAVLVGGVAGGWLIYGEGQIHSDCDSNHHRNSVAHRPHPHPHAYAYPQPNPAAPGPIRQLHAHCSPGSRSCSHTLTPWPTNTPALPVVTVSR